MSQENNIEPVIDIEELRKQLYQIQFVSYITLCPGDLNYVEGKNLEIPVDNQIIFNGDIGEIISFIYKNYGKSIVLKVDLYSAKKGDVSNVESTK